MRFHCVKSHSISSLDDFSVSTLTLKRDKVCCVFVLVMVFVAIARISFDKLGNFRAWFLEGGFYLFARPCMFWCLLWLSILCASTLITNDYLISFYEICNRTEYTYYTLHTNRPIYWKIEMNTPSLLFISFASSFSCSFDVQHCSRCCCCFCCCDSYLTWVSLFAKKEITTIKTERQDPALWLPLKFLKYRKFPHKYNQP